MTSGPGDAHPDECPHGRRWRKSFLHFDRHPDDEHVLVSECIGGACPEVHYFVPMMFSRFVSLLKWPSGSQEGNA